MQELSSERAGPLEPVAGLQLHAGDLRLALRPDLGGSIAGLWHGEEPVLRSTEPAELARARLSACYPLIPYSNRLGFRRFRWHGRDHTTLANFDHSPHSVHGVGWTQPWTVCAQAPGTIELGLEHTADGHWPFDFSARQVFTLDEQGLHVALTLINRAHEAVPAGLGWHPYFPKRQRSRLHAELTDRWESDPGTELPTRRVPQPGIDSEVSYLSFDHCFEGWQGAARLRDERLSLRLTSSLSYLVVYTPADKSYYCVEPVSHVSNAIHMADPAAHGLRTLQPGQALQAWMRLDVSRA
jgi:aldose 1-epimerase